MCPRGQLGEQAFHLGDNKEVFDAEVFAIYQALRVFESRGRFGRRFAVFSDCQPAIQRAGSDVLGPGQCWARAIIEVASLLVACSDEVAIYWVPAHAGVTGNEKTDEMAKEAAGSRAFDVQDEVRWQASLPYISRRATESRARATSLWIRDHVRPERRYHPTGGQASNAELSAESESRQHSDTTSCCPATLR